MAQHEPGSGSIFGLVTEDGIVKDASPVYLMDMRRNEGVGKAIVLKKQLTEPDGTFVFNGLNASYDGYALMASDEDDTAGEYKNALAQDRVQPIFGHTEATWGFNWLADAMNRKFVSGLLPLNNINYVDNTIVAPQTFYGGFFAQTTIGTGNTAKHEENWDGFTYNSGSFTPGAPEFGAYALASDTFMFTVGATETFPDITTYGFTTEFVFDHVAATNFSAKDPAIGLFAHSRRAEYWATIGTPRVYDQDTDDRSMLSPMHMFRYDIATNEIKWYVATDNANLRSQNETPYLNYPLYEEIAAVSLAAYTEPVHVAAVYRFGSRGGLFINGQLEVEITACPGILDFTTFFVNSSQTKFSYITAVGTAHTSNRLAEGGAENEIGASYAVGPIASFSEPLSDADVVARYNMLMTTNVLPVRTGYEKAAITQTPEKYFRLGDSVLDASNPALPVIPANTIPENALQAGVATTSTLEPSPVLSGNATHFSGGRLESTYGGFYFPSSAMHVTFMSWVKLDLATPSAAEEIVSTYTTSWAVNQAYDRKNLTLWRNTSGLFVLSGYVNDIWRDYVFADYTPPIDAWLHVTASLDIGTVANPLATLRVGTETITPATVSTVAAQSGFFDVHKNVVNAVGSRDLYDALSGPDHQIIGIQSDVPDRPTAALTVAEDFTGSLCELAIFSRVLSDAAVLDIWTAKDAA